MTKKPLVSVVVAAFNGEKHIERLVRSVWGQTYKKVEIIVVDDGSEDATVEIAKRNGAKVFARKHAERSVQRNFGAKIARGEYLLVIDVDMELTKGVIEDCVNLICERGYRVLVIPEKTVVVDRITRIRAFEREMYMGDMSVEVARFFEKSIFHEFGGYDPALTGPEDYDLPYRVGKKYEIGRAEKYILHHEEGRSLWDLMKRKYKYAKGGARYAEKHPELVLVQGNLLFRKVYLKNWRRFAQAPLLGAMFLGVRILEMVSAIAGYVSAVGLVGFGRTLLSALERRR